MRRLATIAIMLMTVTLPIAPGLGRAQSVEAARAPHLDAVVLGHGGRVVVPAIRLQGDVGIGALAHQRVGKAAVDGAGRDRETERRQQGGGEYGMADHGASTSKKASHRKVTGKSEQERSESVRA